MVMTPHFSLAEFTKSQTALRMGINNDPPEHVKARLKILAQKVLEPVRNHFGKPVRISSGYRCLELNEVVGSKSTSQHIHGFAADFEIPGVANIEVARWMVKELDFDMVLLEFYNKKDPAAGWVHCSYLGENNRQKVLTYNGKRYTNGLPE